MRIQGAVICEQGQTFAVVVVKQHVVKNSSEAADAIRSLTPAVLMAQDSRGRDLLRQAPTSPSSWRRFPFMQLHGVSTRSVDRAAACEC